MAFTKITNADLTDKGVIGLADTPQLSTTAMQEKFEETVRTVVIPKHNALIDELEANTGASNIGTTKGNLQSDIDNLERKTAASSGNISQLVDALADVEADVTALQTDNVQNKADIAQNKGDIAANITQIATNTADINTLKTSSAQSTSKIATLEADNTTNKNAIATLKNDTTVLNAKAHTHTNKSVLDALTDVSGDLQYKGKPISGGGSSDAYGHIKVGSVTLDALGDDTFELIGGTNVTLTPDPKTKQVVISSAGGGGGTSTGDMLKTDYVLPGGTGQVLSAKDADHATNADNATNAAHATTADTALQATEATKADQVGSASTSVLEKLGDVGGALYYGTSRVGDAIDDKTIKRTGANKELEVQVDNDTIYYDNVENKLKSSGGTKIKYKDYEKLTEAQRVGKMYDILDDEIVNSGVQEIDYDVYIAKRDAHTLEPDTYYAVKGDSQTNNKEAADIKYNDADSQIGANNVQDAIHTLSNNKLSGAYLTTIRNGSATLSFNNSDMGILFVGAADENKATGIFYIVGSPSAVYIATIITGTYISISKSGASVTVSNSSTQNARLFWLSFSGNIPTAS